MAQYRIPTTSKVLSLLNQRGGLGKVAGIEDIPPSAPSIGDKYIVGNNPSGDWLGHETQIAEWDGIRWVFTTPRAGDYVYVESLSNYRYFVNGDWRDIDYLSDITVDLAEDGVFFNRSRFGFNTSVLSSVLNVETQEDVDFVDIRKLVIISDTYQVTGSYNDVDLDGRDIVFDDLGNFYYIYNNGVIIKYDSNYNLVWSKNIDFIDEYYIFTAEKVSDGIVLGGSDIYYDLVLIKIDFDCNVQWAYKYAIDANDTVRGMVTDSNDNIYVSLVNANGILVVIKLNNLGEVQVIKGLNSDDISTWYEYDHNQIALTTTEDYLMITAYPYYLDVGTYIGTVIKLNVVDLSVVWAKRYADVYFPITSIVWDGTYYVLSNNPKGADGYYDMMITRIDTNGNVIDYKRFDSLDTTVVSTMLATEVAVVSDGYVLMSRGSIVLAKLDTNLNLVKAYKTSYDLFATLAYNDKIFVNGFDGYMAVLDKDLSLLALDTNWTDVTTYLTSVDFLFNVTDRIYTSGDVLYTRTASTTIVADYLVTFQIHAQDGAPGDQDIQHYLTLDSDGNLSVLGGLKVGDSALTVQGMIKLDVAEDDLKGYVRGEWKSLTKNGTYIPETDEVEMEVE